MSRPAVLIDRDGTLNVNVHHLRRVADLQLIAGAGEAVARLNAAGYPVVVITNQSAVARGLLSEGYLNEIHVALKQLLLPLHAHVDGIYYCPHHPEEGVGMYRTVCACRKPAPGMLLQAAMEHDLDLTRSIMVGDNISDLEAGWAAGCQSALVKTGYGEETWDNAHAETRARMAYVGRDLGDVVDWVLIKGER